MNIIENKVYDEERSLYNLKNSQVINCTFAGEKDGESVLKEARNIEVINCNFELRYPLWHVDVFLLKNSTLTDLSRAPLWYCKNGQINNVEIKSVKPLRECSDITVSNSNIDSIEFGWKCNNLKVDHCKINSVYIFF